MSSFQIIAGLIVFSLVTGLSYILIIYCSFTGVVSVSLQVTSLLYVDGSIMMSPLFKAIIKFCTTNYLFTNLFTQKPKMNETPGPPCVGNVTYACLLRLLVCLFLGINCHSSLIRFADDEPSWLETFD